MNRSKRVFTPEQLRILDKQEVLSRTKMRKLKTISDMAYKLMIENGINDTTLNDIADGCDITRRTIYNYFDTKINLLNYLMIEITKEIDPDFHIDYNYDHSAIENFERALKINFDAYYRNIDKFKFITQVRMYLSYQKYENDYKDVSLAMHDSFVVELVNIIERGLQDKSIKQIDYPTKKVALMIYQSLYGYLSTITIGKDIAYEKYIEKCQIYEYMIIRFLKAKK
ncbi:MAG: TetR/AcrR family transcriptional regulator [Bacilli bacterium]|jgi:AcrR family transcriptional regulator|nr:TetR/AcrR family transcriptional regulator [Bacilli bacterium]